MNDDPIWKYIGRTGREKLVHAASSCKASDSPTRLMDIPSSFSPYHSTSSTRFVTSYPSQSTSHPTRCSFSPSLPPRGAVRSPARNIRPVFQIPQSPRCPHHRVLRSSDVHEATGYPGNAHSGGPCHATAIYTWIRPTVATMHWAATAGQPLTARLDLYSPTEDRGSQRVCHPVWAADGSQNSSGRG